MARLLEKGNALPRGSQGFTISTYNVLLPNSVDGWWIYKYYQKHVPMDQRTWEHRSELTKKNILGFGGGADIVCVQETSAESFDDDFNFLKEAGYNYVLHSKFRFRVATFFRKEKFILKCEKHGDRSLTTLLEFKDKSDDDIIQEQDRSVFIVNVHLTGGPSPDKRVRQIHDATELIRKEINKRNAAMRLATGGKKDDNNNNNTTLLHPSVIICGDFNEEGDTAVNKLLCEGLVPAGCSDKYCRVVTTKLKKQELGLFRDAHDILYSTMNAGLKRPPTLICPNLVEHFVLEEATEPLDGGATQLIPTPKLVKALKKAWEALTHGRNVMKHEEMKEWLVKINVQLGRGSEYRNALAVLEEKRRAGEAEVLTFDDYLGLYVRELHDGKFWGVDHDLRQRLDCPVDGAGEGQSFHAVYDYIYYNPGLKLEAIREELSKDELSLALEGDDPLPNAWQPSDHVMQTAAFSFY
mmetsp:Transcript_26854/g.38543  ORF Transcript_26854/g.38543 Transcript_26854/m.38543 type:complete len:467 (+) Transcript_26854:267-1667(+)|eukprot:CAMPEP_0172436906 /NCGR_PEP_ID=MMETSP1064-20121228/71969_1 /TAXON_ID=202472 /ORGANISM="Aulacoseira subarctica , Strain CCAP 1002/5" /LENGTH=466 /DNA_ID=CAMNT_0013185335 /DNA_START=188 /DNA_END=1588 /DNA_ORIENTATION=+